jgi:hypothetical protein
MISGTPTAWKDPLIPRPSFRRETLLTGSAAYVTQVQVGEGSGVNPDAEQSPQSEINWTAFRPRYNVLENANLFILLAFECPAGQVLPERSFFRPFF